MQLEEIKINITADTKSAIRSLDQLGSALKTLDKLGGKGTNLSKINAEVMQFANNISNLSDRTIYNLGKLADAFGRLSGIKIDPSVSKAVSDLGDNTERLSEIDVTGQFTQMGGAVSSATQSLEENSEVAASDAAEIREVAIANNENTLATNANTAATNRETSATRANTSAKKAGSTATHHYSNALTKLAATFKRILLYRAIRSIIRGFTQALKTGITNLYQYSQALNSADGSKFAQTMDSYASIALKLKNSLAAALVPVINAVLPLVQKLAGWLVAAANAVARFFAVLNGQDTYTVAKDVATTWGDDAAKSIGGANDAAEELKRTLLGFDEINALDKPNKGGSGGGGGGGGSSLSASDMFEEKKTGVLTGVWAKLADWAKTLKEDAEIIWGWVKKIFNKLEQAGVFDAIINFVDSILRTVDGIVQDLDRMGVIDEIADALGEILKSAVEIWNSDAVQQLISVISKAGADDLKNILLTISEALQTVASLLNGDAEGFIEHFGKTVIEALHGIIKGIYNVIHITLTSIGGAIETVIGVILDGAAKIGIISQDTAESMKKSVSDSVNGVLNGVEKAGREIDKTYQMMKMGWDNLFEAGSDKAEQFYHGLATLSSYSVDLIYKAYQDGKYQIENDKITFDVDGNDVYDTIIWLEGEYEGMVTDIDGNPVVPQMDASEMEKVIENLSNGDITPQMDDQAIADYYYHTWNLFSIYHDKIYKTPLQFSTDDSKYQQTLRDIQNSWKGTTLETKNLPVSDKGAKATMDGTATYWKNENFQNKSLSVTTGKAEEAMRGVRDYWNGLSFAKKGISVAVNLPSGTHVNWYAEGGLVNSGELFVARENGLAEMVGSFGSRTAVANNDQIVAGIASGVSAAMSTQNSLLSEQNSLLKSILAKSGNVTISTSSIIDGLNRTNRRTGRPVVAMG